MLEVLYHRVDFLMLLLFLRSRVKIHNVQLRWVEIFAEDLYHLFRVLLRPEVEINGVKSVHMFALISRIGAGQPPFICVSTRSW